MKLFGKRVPPCMFTVGEIVATYGDPGFKYRVRSTTLCSYGYVIAIIVIEVPVGWEHWLGKECVASDWEVKKL